MKILGYRQVNFTAPDGNKINGYSIYYSEPFGINEKNCSGLKTDKLFVNVEKFNALIKEFEKKNLSPVGQEIIVYYNRYGKPEQILPR